MGTLRLRSRVGGVRCGLCGCPGSWGWLGRVVKLWGGELGRHDVDLYASGRLLFIYGHSGVMSFFASGMETSSLGKFPKWGVSSFDHDEQERTPAPLADRGDHGGGHRSVRAPSRWGRARSTCLASFVTYPTDFVKTRTQFGGQVRPRPSLYVLGLTVPARIPAGHHPHGRPRERRRRALFGLFGACRRERRQGWRALREL